MLICLYSQFLSFYREIVSSCRTKKLMKYSVFAKIIVFIYMYPDVALSCNYNLNNKFTNDY